MESRSRILGFLFASLISSGVWAGNRAVLTTTDYSSGSVAVVDLETNEATVNVLNVHSDAGVRVWDGKVYVINRLGQDNILVLDASDLSVPERQFSVGNGSNPYDIAFVSESKAYVSRYALDRLLVVNPSTGDSLGSVDLSFVADSDGVPEASQLVVYGNRLYVVCQRLDRDKNFQPTDRSEVVVVDVNTGEAVDVDPGQGGVQGIVLSARNPVDVVQRGSKLYLSCAGSYGDLTDGGIEVVDLEANRTEGVLIGESDLGGDAGSLAIGPDSRGYVVVSDASFVNHVVGFDLAVKRVEGALSGLSGGYTPDIAVLGNRLYVLDQGSWGSPESAGVRVYDVATGTLLAGPIATGLPPSAIAFLEDVSTEAPTADFDGNGTVDFQDFLLFAAAFGKSRGDPKFDSRFDLNRDDRVDFDDFLLFAAAYIRSAGSGKPVGATRPF